MLSSFKYAYISTLGERRTLWGEQCDEHTEWHTTDSNKIAIQLTGVELTHTRPNYLWTIKLPVLLYLCPKDTNYKALSRILCYMATT